MRASNAQITVIADWRGIVLATSGKRATSEPASAAEPPDEVELCRRGDRNALDAVFRRYASTIERVLARIVGPRPDLEDLLQEVFSAAIISFPRFRGEASIKTWLHRIAINVAYKHLRSPRHRREVPLDESEIAHPQSASPVDKAVSREQAARLYHHLDAIDARKRIAFVLHVVEDLPIAEVAALTGASKTATKSRIFWARRALLKRLARDPNFGGTP